jgi:hypothetical protein
MHAVIEFERHDFTCWQRGENVTLKQRQRLAELFPKAQVCLDEVVPKEFTYDWSSKFEWEDLVDLGQVGEELVRMGVPFKIKRFSGCYKVQQPTAGDNHTVNIQVAIPNLLLFAVDEVMVLEDACTNNLQSYLDEGYRILAVCPPPAQRRPDYILGRQKVVKVK